MKWTLFAITISLWSPPTSIAAMTGYASKDDCMAARAVVAEQLEPLKKSLVFVCWPPAAAGAK